MLPHTLALLLYDDDFSEWMQPTKLEEVPRRGNVQLEAKDDSLQAPTPSHREMRETQSIAQPAAVQLRETISDADDLGPLTFESDLEGEQETAENVIRQPPGFRRLFKLELSEKTWVFIALLSTIVQGNFSTWRAEVCRKSLMWSKTVAAALSVRARVSGL